MEPPGFLPGYGRLKKAKSNSAAEGNVHLISEARSVGITQAFAPCETSEEAQRAFAAVVTSLRSLMGNPDYRENFDFDESTPNVMRVQGHVQDDSKEPVPTLTIQRVVPASNSSDSPEMAAQSSGDKLPHEEARKENIQVTVENLAGNQSMVEMVKEVMPTKGPLYINECGNADDVVEFVKAFGDRIRIPNNLLADQAAMDNLKGRVENALKDNMGDSYVPSKLTQMFFNPVQPAITARHKM